MYGLDRERLTLCIPLIHVDMGQTDQIQCLLSRPNLNSFQKQGILSKYLPLHPPQIVYYAKLQDCTCMCSN